MPNPEKIPVGTDKYKFDDVKEILEKKYAADNTKYLFGKNSKQIRIKKIDTIHNKTEKYFCLLLSLCDKSVPDAIYEEFDTGNTRKLVKTEDEGNPFSAHILINEKKLKHDTHSMVIERVPGLSTSVIRRYLRKIFNDKQYMKTYEGKNKNFIPYYPLFQINGHPSNTIRHALSDGILKDIELVSFNVKNDGFDEIDYIQEVKQKTTLIIKRGIETNTDDGWMENIIKKCRKENRQDMFIRIETKDKKIKQTRVNTDIDLKKESILDQFFIHNEIVNDFTPSLEQSHEEIRYDLVENMIEIAENNYKL